MIRRRDRSVMGRPERTIRATARKAQEAEDAQRHAERYDTPLPARQRRRGWW